MLKGTFLTEEEMDSVAELLDKLDVEIGSTLSLCKVDDRIFRNMQCANNILHNLKSILGE